MSTAGMPEEGLYALYRHVAGFVENTSIVSTNACLPYIADEAPMKIVSTAVIDYLSLGPVVDDDPLGHFKVIIGMIEDATLENEGAAFGGLLHMGDKRVCDLLIPVRDGLDREAMNTAVR
jgi:hypothetical protein